ncbi:MAG: carbon starvation CstA family protein [Thermodesulfobacteriota bacterium]
MNAAVVAITAIVLFLVGYRFYAAFLAKKVFKISDSEITPAHEMEDGVDYVPAKKGVLFGHHFSSIAGAAPIIGPAIAVFWGWVPAVLWVVLGTIFMGAVHDFSALVISARNRGSSVGDIAGDLITPRVRTLFLIIVYFLVFFVMAVFAYAIAVLFVKFPSSVLPVNLEIVMALVLGFIFYRKKSGSTAATAVAHALLIAAIWAGTKFHIAVPELAGSQVVTWVVFLFGYAFVASVLPVWTLLQPRDYLNSFQLVAGLVLLVAGIIALNPEITAPAFNAQAVSEGAPIVPFLFVTIACGAISGFHGLVSSGTTSKQLDKMSHCHPIGYGCMLGEGTLAVIAILAVTAGIGGAEWFERYGTWDMAKNGGMTNFVDGAAVFLEGLRIPREFGITIISVLVISFAATSLDTAARIQRLVVGELGAAYKVDFLKNRYAATFVAVAPAFLLAILAQAPGRGPGSGGFILWPLFGATNQLIAGLTLLVATVYLWKTKRPFIYTLVPMIFVILAAGGSVVFNIFNFAGNRLLQGLSVCVFILTLWLLFEAAGFIRRNAGRQGGG